MSHVEGNWKYAEDFAVEPEHIAAARVRAVELGAQPIEVSVAAQVSAVASAAGVQRAIEIGTGAGVSGLWLLRSRPGLTLTSIDKESEYQQAAREAFGHAGVAANRYRLISGNALELLPRMNEESYDLVFIDADPESVIEYVEHGLRLAGPTGTVLLAHALWHGRVADPAKRNEIESTYRSLLTEIRGSDAVLSSLLPIGDGLLQITKRAPQD